MILLSWLFLLTILVWVTEIPWMFLLISLSSVFALLLKLQIKYKENLFQKERKKEGRKGENSLMCSVIFLCVIFLQDVCSPTVVFNRWEAACFLSEFTPILVLGAVCWVGSDFIETKSRKKDKNYIESESIVLKSVT